MKRETLRQQTRYLPLHSLAGDLQDGYAIQRLRFDVVDDVRKRPSKMDTILFAISVGKSRVGPDHADQQEC
jgi:hypothetical protein